VIIRTYESGNSPDRLKWIAFIDMGEGDYMPVRFNGETEGAAISSAQAEWDKHQVERERNIAAREEGRRKAAETRERKKASK
jgi:hypothetical protein